MWLYKKFFIILITINIVSCGFQPLYGTKQQETTFLTFSKINIAQIKNRTGQLLYNELERLLHPLGRKNTYTYNLNTKLSEKKTSLGVKKSALATRGNLIMTAKYSLTKINGASIINNSQKQITVSYNLFTSNFATMAAQSNARARAIKELAQEIRNHLGVALKSINHKTK